MLFITISLAMGAFSRRMNDRTGKASALVCATKKDLEDAGFILKAEELMRLRGKRTAERSPRNLMNRKKSVISDTRPVDF